MCQIEEKVQQNTQDALNASLDAGGAKAKSAMEGTAARGCRRDSTLVELAGWGVGLGGISGNFFKSSSNIDFHAHIAYYFSISSILGE